MLCFARVRRGKHGKPVVSKKETISADIIKKSLINTLALLSKELSYAGAHLVKHQRGGRKPSETSVTEFCNKRVNLCLEELNNIKVIFP